jgi:hypothetical protein
MPEDPPRKVHFKSGGVIATGGLSGLGDEVGGLVLAALESEIALAAEDLPTVSDSEGQPRVLEFEPPTTPGGAILSHYSIQQIAA